MTIKQTDQLIDLLEELEEYMDNRADAESFFHDIDVVTVGNKEMHFLSEIQIALHKLKKYKQNEIENNHM